MTPSERASATQKYKRSRHKAGSAACDVCGWSAPWVRAWVALHAHHVLPVRAGGTNDEANLMLLCPNHHAVAHYLGRVLRGVYYGPRTRSAMVDALRNTESVPEEDRRRRGQARVSGLISEAFSF